MNSLQAFAELFFLLLFLFELVLSSETQSSLEAARKFL